MSLKNKFENRFSKPKTGFRFSNRKPDFRFSINMPNYYLQSNKWNSSILILKQLPTVNALTVPVPSQDKGGGRH